MTASPVLKSVAPMAELVAVKPRSKRRLLMVALPLALLLAGGGYWLTGGRYESTENANLHQARLSIASDIAGRVVSVGIADNQPVKAGDVLFQVDPEPYRLALAQAEVGVESARLAVEQLKVSYRQATVQAKLAEDDAAYQLAELERQQTLLAKGVATGTSLEDAQHLALRASEQRMVANQSVASVLAALGGDPEVVTDSHPTVQAAIVARDRAKYNLDLTTVKAPADGVVYQASSFKPGQMVAAGQALFALVETGDVWVEANFKETQLASIAVGQAVEVTFDLNSRQAYAGTVEAIGAGTGAEFSLLPAQNATGNWVKVTQRVPVRVQLNDRAAVTGLASGMSAEVTVDTGQSRSLGALFAPAPAEK